MAFRGPCQQVAHHSFSAGRSCGCWLQGDDYVDWVGCSIYHFGTSYPYGANVDPLPRTFTSTVGQPYLSESSHAFVCCLPAVQGACYSQASFRVQMMHCGGLPSDHHPWCSPFYLHTWNN